MFAIPVADLTGRQRPDAFESTAKRADANAAPGGNHARQEKLFGGFIPADPFLPGSGVIAIMIKPEYLTQRKKLIEKQGQTCYLFIDVDRNSEIVPTHVLFLSK